MEQSDNVPILIIGGGPSGLTLGYMLAQLGGTHTLSFRYSNAICTRTNNDNTVPSLIIERYPTRLDAPKAHALSPRSLELCRQFGLDVNEIRRLGTNRHDGHWVNFITSLNGKLVGRLPYERMDKEVLEATPTVCWRDILYVSTSRCWLINAWLDDP